MPCRQYILLGCLLLFINLFAIYTGKAQNASLEFWPEADIWYTLSPSWRLSSFIPVTKYNESKSRDLNIYLQADYKWGKTKYLHFRRLVDENREMILKPWMARAGIMKGFSLGENTGGYEEEMVFGEIHKKLPMKKSFLISHRFRTDLRWLGDNNDFSYRFRYRFMLEKDLNVGRSSIVPYTNIEFYWDSRFKEFNRIRAIVGATFSRGSILAYEANFTYQSDSYYDTNNLYALNIILHIFL